MRTELLGLTLEAALARLGRDDVRVRITEAPRRVGAQEGVLRVVHAADDGSALIVSRFLDPLNSAANTPETEAD